MSWVVARRAERLATLGVAAAAAGGLAVSLLVVASASVGATVGFLMLAGIATAMMIALTFPLGMAGSSHVSVALVGGLLNVAWAISGLLGPTLGGAAPEPSATASPSCCWPRSPARRRWGCCVRAVRSHGRPSSQPFPDHQSGLLSSRRPRYRG